MQVFLVAATLTASALLSHGQTTNAQCKPGNEWSFNSLNQSPCLMAAYIIGACEPDGRWDVQALPDVTFQYRGPSTDEANVCTCSSIAYALSSACAMCQGAGWPEWSVTWTKNCPAQFVNNGSFPHPIPNGTRIPEWAFVPIAGFYDMFDAVQAERICDKLESTGTATPTGSPTSSLSGSVPSQVSGGNGSPTDVSSSPSIAQKPNLAPILGGVIGGLVTFAIIIGLVIYFCLLHRRRRRPVLSSKKLEHDSSVVPIASDTKPSHSETDPLNAQTSSSTSFTTTPLSDAPTLPITPPPTAALSTLTPMRLYDPSDPSTFPATPPPLSGRSPIDLTQVTYPNVTHQVPLPIPEL